MHKSISFGFILLMYCLSYSAKSQTNAERLRHILSPYFVPVEHNYEKLDKNKVDLGRYLFFDKNISENNIISCNNCHNLNKYGTNGSYFIGSKEKGNSSRDVPSLYNLGSLNMFNADGGLTSLNDKLKQAFTDSNEMNVQNINQILKQIENDAKYQSLFKAAYPNHSKSISFEQVIEALEAFIIGLKTPAPIDSFLNGDDTALTSEQVEGGHVFNSKSCYSCHTGSNFGGQMIQKLGIAEKWPNQKDLGYYHVKKLSAYKMFFRVAPLRNVEKTAPYFHDGSSNDLGSAIKLMGRHERGMEISEADISKIIQFLNSLTGEIPTDYIINPFN